MRAVCRAHFVNFACYLSLSCPCMWIHVCVYGFIRAPASLVHSSTVSCTNGHRHASSFWLYSSFKAPLLAVLLFLLCFQTAASQLTRQRITTAYTEHTANYFIEAALARLHRLSADTYLRVDSVRNGVLMNSSCVKGRPLYKRLVYFH